MPRVLGALAQAALLLPLRAASSSEGREGDNFMNCGQGVPLCGTLTLESGAGAGAYHHQMVRVHGLWPETGTYGNSQCISPKSLAEPTQVYPCYNQTNRTFDDLLGFERHEWDKHGKCTGVASEKDFFEQICNMAQAPSRVMEASKLAGRDLQGMADDLKKAGYPVWKVDPQDDQVLLPACAAADGRWVVAQVADFPAHCGGKGPSPGPSPSPPAPSPSPPAPKPSPPAPKPAGACVRGRRGPKCHSDEDCSGLTGCLRCSHHGYCTDVPLPMGELLV